MPKEPMSCHGKYIIMATFSKSFFTKFFIYFNLQCRMDLDFHPLLPPTTSPDWVLDNFSEQTMHPKLFQEA